MDLDTFIAELERITTASSSSLDLIETLADLQAWDRQFLGTQGELTLLMKSLGGVDKDDRPEAGRRANVEKTALVARQAQRKTTIERREIDATTRL